LCEEKFGKRIYILDASALIFGFMSSSDEMQITCREVLEEVKFGEAAVYRATVIREGVGPKIIEPREEYVEAVKREVTRIGETGLSDADIKLLALALMFKDNGWEPVIVSADYAIQNTAFSLNIKVEPIIHKGIEKVIVWISYCPKCKWVGGVFKEGICPNCGSKLKRRPKR